jgi:tRNA A37 threonylcarbamoyladenosine modification protein TsaB
LLVNRLILENSGEVGSIVVAHDQLIVLDQSFRGSVEMTNSVDAASKRFGLPDEIVVGIGPGSYTGLRVAIATALGLKLALGCRTFGCPSILGYQDDDYLVLGDARRGAVFIGEIREGKMNELPRLLPKTEVAAHIAAVGKKRIYATTPLPEIPEVEAVLPQARYLLGRDASYHDLSEPIYLKEPHITRPE